jgi:hypothetical protein
MTVYRFYYVVRTATLPGRRLLPSSRTIAGLSKPLHAGRTALGFAATLIFLWASMS